MTKRGWVLLFLASSLIAQGQLSKQAASLLDPLRCELQATNADTLSVKPWSHINFILLSGHDGLRVFTDWNSWGYFARSFTLTDSDSNKHLVTARDHLWDKNYPATVTIDRGEVLVTDVYLCDGSWQVSPKLPLKENYWTVTGHFAQHQETDPLFVRNFKTDKVWQGAIDSPPVQLVLTKDCVRRLNAEKKH